MTRLTALSLVCLVGAAFVAGQAVRPFSAVAAPASQPDDGAGGTLDAAMQASMEAMAAAGTPGQHHHSLDLMLGTWDGTMSWRPAPDAALMSFPGTAVRDWILDGRFLREVVTAQSPDGAAFEGIGYTGYNNLDHRFETTWMDSMSTAIMGGHAEFNSTTKVFTFHMTRRDPASGRVITCWSEMDVSDPNRHVLRGWEYAEDGSAYQNSEGVFTRRR